VSLFISTTDANHPPHRTIRARNPSSPKPCRVTARQPLSAASGRHSVPGPEFPPSAGMESVRSESANWSRGVLSLLALWPSRRNMILMLWLRRGRELALWHSGTFGWSPALPSLHALRALHARNASHGLPDTRSGCSCPFSSPAHWERRSGVRCVY
jgi:hypothetical protein